MCVVPQVEGLKHSHKLDLANVRLECARSKGELERERDALQGQIDGRHAHTHTDDRQTHTHTQTQMTDRQTHTHR